MLQYNFRVNTLDYLEAISSRQPDSNINNIVYQLENATVWVNGVDRPLKHGDVFSLTGPKAAYAYSHHVEQFPYILETYDIPRVRNLSISGDGDEVTISWTSNPDFYASIEIRIGGGEWIKRSNRAKGLSSTTIIGVAGQTFEVRMRFTDNYCYSTYYAYSQLITLEAEVGGYLVSEDLAFCFTSEDGEFYICPELS
jgi:hypothetical protein